MIVIYRKDMATYSLWRDEEDYWIKWEMSAEKIQIFINALGFPYKGAKTIVENNAVRILECSIEEDIKFEIRTPG